MGRRASIGVLASIDAILSSSEHTMDSPASTMKKGVSQSCHERSFHPSLGFSPPFRSPNNSLNKSWNNSISNDSIGLNVGNRDYEKIETCQERGISASSMSASAKKALSRPNLSESNHSKSLSISIHSLDKSDDSIGLGVSTHSIMSIPSIMSNDPSSRSLNESLALEEDESITEDDTAASPPVLNYNELAEQLQSPPVPSPGIFKKRRKVKKSRKSKLKANKKMASSLSVIDTLLGKTEEEPAENSFSNSSPELDFNPPEPTSPPETPNSKAKRKEVNRKQNLIDAMKESRDKFAPFAEEDEEELVTSRIPRRRHRRRATLNAQETFDTDTNSMRERKKQLGSSLQSEMPSSLRSGHRTVETSSRRSRRTVDGDGNSSRRSRRSVGGGENSSRRSKRTTGWDDDGSSSRSSRRSVSSASSVKSASSKKKKKKKAKSKRRSSESQASNSTSVTADMDASWTSIREDSVREDRQEKEEEEPHESEEGEYQLPTEEGEEGEMHLPIHEEREYDLPLPEEDAPEQSLFKGPNNDLSDSLHRLKRGSSSSSSLDLSDEEDDIPLAENKRTEMQKSWKRNDSLGALNRYRGDDSSSSDDDDDEDEEILGETKEEVKKASSGRSLTRERSSRRGLSCDAGSRGREEEQARTSKRGFSVSPTRHSNQMMMEPRRPFLSCMKGSRRKMFKVKLKNPHVRFNECMVVTPIIPTYELASKKSDLWFKQKDFDKILNRSMAIALRVKEGKKTKKCVRGLEHFLKDKEERYAAWNAVLVEQEIQNLSGNHSDVRICEKYLAASTTCRQAAQQLAQDDYDAIVNYILEDS